MEPFLSGAPPAQAPELLLELFESGTEQLLDALPSVWDGSAADTLVPQAEDGVTHAAKVRPEEAELRLDHLSALTAHNRVRAFAGWPSTWCLVKIGDAAPLRAKLLVTRVDPVDAQPSRVLSITTKGDALRFVCGDGSVLEVLKLTMPGRKPVNAKAFWNGLNGRSAEWVSE